VKASPSQSAAGIIVAALALVALASGRTPPQPAAALRRAPALHVSSTALRALRDGETLDINRAAPGDLVLLPGVGPKLAQRIVDERKRRGRYQRLEELLEVKGIGRATLERLSRFVRVTDETTDRAAVMRSD
jgi:competence ComEA-like helix-hairpin-helix protein